MISESHEGACGGHKYWKATSYKILRAGYYWPSLFSYVYQQVRARIPCQKFADKQKLLSLPLKPIAVSAPFQQWGQTCIYKPKQVIITQWSQTKPM